MTTLTRTIHSDTEYLRFKKEALVRDEQRKLEMKILIDGYNRIANRLATLRADALYYIDILGVESLPTLVYLVAEVLYLELEIKELDKRCWRLLC